MRISALIVSRAELVSLSKTYEGLPAKQTPAKETIVVVVIVCKLEATMSTTDSNKKRKTTTKSADAGVVDATKYHDLEKELPDAKDKLEKTEKELAQSKERIKELELKARASTDDGLSEDDDEESVTNPNDPWEIKYKELREHRIIHGNCVVSQKGANPQLGNWILNQKKMQKNGKLKQERFLQLDSLGLSWGRNCTSPVSWDTHFEDLAKFAKAMGHCNVTVNANSPSALGKWVSLQRVEYRRFGKGRDSLLTLDQIRKLNAIGFNWKGPRLF